MPLMFGQYVDPSQSQDDLLQPGSLEDEVEQNRWRITCLKASQEADKRDATLLTNYFEVVGKGRKANVIDNIVYASALFGELENVCVEIGASAVVDSLKKWTEFFKFRDLVVGGRGDDWLDSCCDAEMKSDYADTSST